MKKSLLTVLITWAFVSTLFIFPKTSFSASRALMYPLDSYMSKAAANILPGITKSGFEYLEANVVRAATDFGALAALGYSSQLFMTKGALERTLLKPATANAFLKRMNFGTKVSWTEPMSYEEIVASIQKTLNEVITLMSAGGATDKQMISAYTNNIVRMLGNASDYLYRKNLSLDAKHKLATHQIFEIQYFLLRAFEQITNSENLAALADGKSINQLWSELNGAKVVVEAGTMTREDLLYEYPPQFLEAFDAFPYKKRYVEKIIQRVHTNVVLSIEGVLIDPASAKYAAAYKEFLAGELVAYANIIASRFRFIPESEVTAAVADWPVWVTKLAEKLEQYPLGVKPVKENLRRF